MLSYGFGNYTLSPLSFLCFLVIVVVVVELEVLGLVVVVCCKVGGSCTKIYII